MDADYAFALLVGIGVPLIFVAAWLKNKRVRQNMAYSQDDSPIEGTLSDLQASEAAQRDAWSHDLRKQLLEEHVLIDRLNTIDGFTDQYMETLLAFLRESGIQCETYFQETVPPGVGISLIARHGIHELYVRKDQASDALEKIQVFRRK